MNAPEGAPLWPCRIGLGIAPRTEPPVGPLPCSKLFSPPAVVALGGRVQPPLDAGRARLQPDGRRTEWHRNVEPGNWSWQLRGGRIPPRSWPCLIRTAKSG